MPALSSALNSALRGIEASQIGLAVASNNISNAQTPGYTRQRAVLAPAPASGDQFRIGGSVQVLGIEAPRDRLVELQIRQATSDAAGERMRQQGLSNIETVFNDSEGAGLLDSLNQFFASFGKLESEPSSTNLRFEVLSAGQHLATMMNRRYADVQTIQSQVDRSMQDDVQGANSLIDQIAATTLRISAEETQEPANELRDQRSALVQRLSEIIDVQELESGGTYQLTTANAQPLVLDGSPVHLQIAQNSSGTNSVYLGVDDITPALTGGKLAARRDLRDSSIPSYLNRLDELAYGLAQAVNTVHAAGYDSAGLTGNNFFTPPTSQQGAAANIAVDAGIVGDLGKIAASGQPNGSGNEVARALSDLVHQRIFSTGTVIEQYQSLIFRIGSETKTADNAATQNESLLSQLENQRQSISGVSVDEETINILQFQRSFQASARVLKAVNDLLDLALTIGQ